MSEEKKKLLKRLKKARKNSINFDKMVYLAEMSVEDFIKNLIEDNNKPSIIPHSPKKPKYTLANILIPIVPVTPNELELLLEYLNFKYLKKNKLRGDYFVVRKCFFRNCYRLKSVEYDCF